MTGLPAVDVPASAPGNAKTTRPVDQNSTQVNNPLFNLRSQSHKSPNDSSKTNDSAGRMPCLSSGSLQGSVWSHTMPLRGSGMRSQVRPPSSEAHCRWGHEVGSAAELSQRSCIDSVPPVSSQCTCERGCSWAQAELTKWPQPILGCRKRTKVECTRTV